MIKNKILLGIFLSLIITVSSQAWLIDGKDYAMLNGSEGLGKVKNEKVSTQSIGVEFGRNFYNDLYVSLGVDYGVISFGSSSPAVSIGSRFTDAFMKLGYRVGGNTILYAKAGFLGKPKLFGPVFGCGIRWDVFNNIGIFAEYNRESVAETGLKDSYIMNTANFGVQLFLKY